MVAGTGDATGRSDQIGEIRGGTANHLSRTAWRDRVEPRAPVSRLERLPAHRTRRCAGGASISTPFGTTVRLRRGAAQSGTALHAGNRGLAPFAGVTRFSNSQDGESDTNPPDILPTVNRGQHPMAKSASLPANNVKRQARCRFTIAAGIDHWPRTPSRPVSPVVPPSPTSPSLSLACPNETCW